MKKRIFSFDVETNGLLGQGFSIGAVIYENGIEVKSFYARCPIEGPIDPWVSENVLPQMEDMKISHISYLEMLKDFSNFFLKNKEGAEVIFHMGIPVEARVILDMHENNFIGVWDGAYPWLDIAGCLKLAGFDCTSVDSYNASHGIIVPQAAEAGGTHNPLYDSRAAALCYISLMSSKYDI